MALVVIPSGLRISQSTFGLESNVRKYKSPFTGQFQVRENAPAIWKLQLTTTAYKFDEEKSIQIKSWLMKLRGGANYFEYGDPDYTAPRGVATGTPVISGGGQSGNTLVTSGWTPSITNILRDGDYFSVNGEFKRVVEDTNSDGSGLATLTFEPPLRVSPPDTTAIITNNPTVQFAVDNTEAGSWSSGQTRLSSFTVAATERLPV